MQTCEINVDCCGLVAVIGNVSLTKLLWTLVIWILVIIIVITVVVVEYVLVVTKFAADAETSHSLPTVDNVQEAADSTRSG